MAGDAETARGIASGLGYAVSGLRRMETGLCHRVFAVELAEGGSIVLRLGGNQTAAAIRGGVRWHGRLAAAGVPVPTLLRFSLDGERPYMILERLPGRDLLFELPGMSDVELRALARELAAVQERVARLPHARGYGFAFDYDDPALAASWADVVSGTLERARRRLAASGACDPAVADSVAGRLPAFARLWRRVEPAAFLDDATTKNVIVYRGRLSGIVDTDQVCFGDPLYTLGLTRMALLSEGLDTAYVEYWAEALGLDDSGRAAVELYTAVFCVDFLGELGQRFNRDSAPAVDADRAQRLVRILDGQLARVDARTRPPR